MIWLLLACGPSPESLCLDARSAEQAAWSEAAAYYERRSVATASGLAQARAEVDAATQIRVAESGRSATYARRSRSGLTDARTGALTADLDANAANRRRAAQAGARSQVAAQAEALALADWLVADHEHRRLSEGASLALDVAEGRRSPEAGRALTDTSLVSIALASSRLRADRCATPRGAGS